MRILSFNTQHCSNFRTGNIDFALIADTIRRLGGEIVGLQEIRGAGPMAGYTDQAKRLSEMLGYHFYFAKAIDVAGENPYGNALLSQYPILSAETVAIPDPTPPVTGGESRCVLKAVVDVGVPLTVLVTHFGLFAPEQVQAAATVERLIEPQNCVLMGDFNVTPENAVLDGIRAAMFDTAELFDAPKWSYPSDVPTEKIDYLFTSPDLCAVFADIPAIVASDHRPYVCDVEI